MKLKLTAAAMRAGVDKSTLRRAIDSGRLSAERTSAGAFLVDASELARWLDARATEAGQTAAPWSDDAGRLEAPRGASRRPEAPQSGATQGFSEATRAIIAEERAAMLAAQLADMKAQRDDAKAERDAWRAQAERLLLTHQPERPATPPEGSGPGSGPGVAAPRPSFWRRLWGG